MIERSTHPKLIDFINKNEEHKNVLLVEGLRQTGKTTAIKMALEATQKPSLSLNLETQKLLTKQIDDTQDFNEFQTLLKRQFNFTPGQGTVLFIDEANESTQLGHYIRSMKEEWTNQTVILTGSLMTRLFRDKDIRIPVGRYEKLLIAPFSFLEFIKANEKISSNLTQFGLYDLLQKTNEISKISNQDHTSLLQLLQHYTTCGGLPQILLNYLDPKKDAKIHNDLLFYLETVKEDFLKLFSQEYENLFVRSLTVTSNLLGQPFKKTAIIRDNNSLANNLLSVLEAWKIIHKVEQKSFNPTKNINFYPKRYLFDVGLAKALREIGLPSINMLSTLTSEQREPLGGLIEQLLYCELSQVYANISGFKEANYEIDFILKTSEFTLPIECKASLKPNKNQYRSLDKYNERFKNKKAALVSLAPYQKVKRKNYTLYHIPIYAVHKIEELINL